MGLKLNPLTGKLDLVSKENFSYNYIPETQTKTIPVNQQMIVYEDISIDGVLIIEGELVVSDFEEVTIISIKETSTSETINIGSYGLIRQTASGITTTLGSPTLGDCVVITNRSGGDNIIGETIQGEASPTISNLESFALVYNGTDYDLV